MIQADIHSYARRQAAKKLGIHEDNLADEPDFDVRLDMEQE